MSKDALSGLIDVDDDDLTVDKDDIGLDDGDEQEIDLEELMASMSAVDEEVDEEDDADDEADDDAEEADTDEDEPDIDEVVNQRVVEEINRILPQRLARDRKTQLVQEVEQMTGMPLEKVRDQIIQNMVEEQADALGISEEEARTIVNDKIENASHKAERTSEKEQRAEADEAMRKVQYLQDKMDFAKSKPKLAPMLTKEVIKEIDSFTQGGSILSFADGANYVLGSKLLNGELINKVQEGAAKKAQAAVKQKRTVPQTNKAGSGKSGGTLTKEQRLVAASLGLTSKEDLAAYAREINTENKRKQNRGR